MRTVPSPPTAAVPPQGAWSVGTLTYDRRDLSRVFLWLLWGDLVLTLMDGGVVDNVVKLQLKNLGASNATIGFLSGTITALLSAIGVAAISTASDRHRGPRGRRVPFMLYSTPPLALCLIAVGFSTQIAHGLEHVAPSVAGLFGRIAMNVLPGVGGLPASAHAVLAVLTTTLVLYKIFDLFPQTVYYCLWADVVPAKLIGAFACCFRIVAALAMFIFERFLLGWASTHPEWLYIGAGALYFVSFTLMCLMIREGDYPPPPPRPEFGSGPIARVIEYIRSSYSIAFYWKYFLMTGAFIIAVKSLQQFVILFGTQTMGLSPQRYGELVSWKNVFVVIPFLILAPIIDRFHPLRTGIAALALVLISGVASFFFISGELSFAICITATFTSIAVYQAATGAINVRILPREFYGQFNSACVIVWQLGWAAASVLCGKFLDVMGDYRYLFLWFAAFCAFGFVMTLFVYRDWMRLGGDEGYIAPVPVPRGARGFEMGAAAPAQPGHPIIIQPADATADKPTAGPAGT